MRRSPLPRDLALALRELPSPPPVYSRLLDVVSRPNWTVAEVANVVSTDTGVCARMLRLANSPFYGVPRQVADVEDAIKLLGIDELRSLVMATTVLEQFRDIPADLLDMRGFQARSVRVAVAGALLAEQGGSVDRSGSFVTGLLHDIGTLVVCMLLPEAVRDVLAAEPGRHSGVDRRVMGTVEAAVGYQLLQRWRLPDGVVTAVRWHPIPFSADAFRRETARLALAVALVDGDAVSDELWTASGAPHEGEPSLRARIDDDFHHAMAVLRDYPD